MRLRQVGLWGTSFGKPPSVLRLEEVVEAEAEAGAGVEGAAARGSDAEGERLGAGKQNGSSLSAEQGRQQQQQQQEQSRQPTFKASPDLEGIRGLSMLWRWDACLAQVSMLWVSMLWVSMLWRWDARLGQVRHCGGLFSFPV